MGEICTDATGTSETVTEAEADLPPLLAVTEAEPAATAVTLPLPSTVATDGLELAQVTVRARVLPPASLGAAVS